MHTAWFLFMCTLQFATYGIFFYHFIISLFLLHKRKNKSSTEKHNKFAIVMAAYNEEKVIAQSLRSIFSVNYPKNLYEVFVVADNCTDNTAIIAENEGATVLKRESSKHGKGHALKWAFDRILNDYSFDAVCIIDADNIADENFLSHINKSFNEGARAVQGYIDTKNPYDSWVSASYYITYLCINKMYQKARHNIGFPIQLNGTGFAVSTDLLHKTKWDPSCLTEDMELTMKMGLMGIYAVYNDKAVVLDEKPVDFITSVKQRTRWMQGQSDIAFRYIIPLFKSMKYNSPIKMLDLIIYLLQPFLFVITGILTVVGIIQAFDPGVSLLYMPSSETSIIFSIIQFLYIPLFLFVSGNLNKRTLKYYIPYLLFIYSWIPVSVLGIIKRKQKSWFHTKHTVNLKKKNEDLVY